MPGTLVIIGGGEDRVGERAVLRCVAELAGGADARVVVIGTATTVPDEVGAIYEKGFGDLVGSMTFLPVGSREEASSPATVEAIDNATAVFFTGGSQDRIAAIFGGSEGDTALRRAWEDRDIVVAGTSAGAAMMSSTMILGGGEQVPTNTVRTGPGLGFVSGIVVDMHFAERGRIARLLAVTAMFPHELGLGIDEDTAVVVHDMSFKVVGNGTVTVIDAGAATNVRLPGAGTGPIALTGARVHVLPSGYAFELSTRTPVITGAPSDTRARELGE